MDFVIFFFRDMIDGWIYYTLLVVNIILILAIIGYMGDRKNAELLKMSMNTVSPSISNGTVNLNSMSSTSNSTVTTPATIPKVAPTTVMPQPQNIPNNNPAPSFNVVQPTMNSNGSIGPNIPLQNIGGNINNQVNNQQPTMPNVQNQRPLGTNTAIGINNNQNAPTPNNQPTPVLIINSNGSNQPQ